MEFSLLQCCKVCVVGLFEKKTLFYQQLHFFFVILINIYIFIYEVQYSLMLRGLCCWKTRLVCLKYLFLIVDITYRVARKEVADFSRS